MREAVLSQTTTSRGDIPRRSEPPRLANLPPFQTPRGGLIPGPEGRYPRTPVASIPSDWPPEKEEAASCAVLCKPRLLLPDPAASAAHGCRALRQPFPGPHGVPASAWNTQPGGPGRTEMQTRWLWGWPGVDPRGLSIARCARTLCHCQLIEIMSAPDLTCQRRFEFARALSTSAQHLCVKLQLGVRRRSRGSASRCPPSPSAGTSECYF